MMLCPKCRDIAIETDWRPKKGLDSRLREYECPDCKYVWYQRIGDITLEKEVENATNIQSRRD